jgi:hypothetical protein
MNNVVAESTNFFIDKAAKVGGTTTSETLKNWIVEIIPNSISYNITSNTEFASISLSVNNLNDIFVYHLLPAWAPFPTANPSLMTSSNTQRTATRINQNGTVVWQNWHQFSTNDNFFSSTTVAGQVLPNYTTSPYDPLYVTSTITTPVAISCFDNSGTVIQITRLYGQANILGVSSTIVVYNSSGSVRFKHQLDPSNIFNNSSVSVTCAITDNQGFLYVAGSLTNSRGFLLGSNRLWYAKYSYTTSLIKIYEYAYVHPARAFVADSITQKIGVNSLDLDTTGPVPYLYLLSQTLRSGGNFGGYGFGNASSVSILSKVDAITGETKWFKNYYLTNNGLRSASSGLLSNNSSLSVVNFSTNTTGDIRPIGQRVFVDTSGNIIQVMHKLGAWQTSVGVVFGSGSNHFYPPQTWMVKTDSSGDNIIWHRALTNVLNYSDVSSNGVLTSTNTISNFYDATIDSNNNIYTIHSFRKDSNRALLISKFSNTGSTLWVRSLSKNSPYNLNPMFAKIIWKNGYLLITAPANLDQSTSYSTTTSSGNFQTLIPASQVVARLPDNGSGTGEYNPGGAAAFNYSPVLNFIDFPDGSTSTAFTFSGSGGYYTLTSNVSLIKFFNALDGTSSEGLLLETSDVTIINSNLDTIVSTSQSVSLYTNTTQITYISSVVATFSGNTITSNDGDRIFVGQQYRPDTRLSGDPLERLEFNLRKRIKDTPGVDGTGVTVSDDRRRIPSNPVFDAAKVAGLELVKKTTQTFSYNRYTPVSGDNVYYNANDWFSEVGRSQRARMAIGGDTQQNFINKRLDEIKQIPQNPRFDALRVMGIEPVYKTSSIITLSKYTPVHNSDYTYYKRYDWFSEVPRSQRARSALGIGNGSPLMFDNLQFVEDFTYGNIKGLADTLVIGYGTSSQTSRLAGRNDPEIMKFTMLQAVKRGKDDLYIINNRHQTSSDAIQTQEIFYNKPGSIFGRSWYQLAPYFSNYSSIFDGKYGSDIVRVGDYHGGVRHSNNRQETIAIWFAPRTRSELLISTDTDTLSVQKSALRSSYSSTTIQTVIRTNRIAQSERLDRTNFWSTTGATVTTSTALLSPLLPYRAVSYDADQLHELFYNQPRQPLYKKWYTIVPLTTRTQSWTSNAINIINVTSSNGQHGAATLINFSIGLDNYFSYGMFVKQRTGVNRVRLYVSGDAATTSVDLMSGSASYDILNDLSLPFGTDLMGLGAGFEIPHYADFDISSNTVLNRVNVSYANITDRSNGWKLIKIAGSLSGTEDSVTDTLPVFRDFVSIRDSLELTSALFDLAPADLLTQTGAVDLTDTGGTEELL